MSNSLGTLSPVKRQKSNSPLLALRRASRPFSHAIIRSETFAKAVEALNNLDGDVQDLSLQLSDSIYKLVQNAGSSAERKELIALRRGVFNRRKLSGQLDVASIHDDLIRYNDLLDEITFHKNQLSSQVYDELRQNLKKATAGKDFELALYASNYRLLDDKEQRKGEGRALSKLDLAKYSYLLRFTTKANPLHLFSSIAGGPRVTVSSASKEQTMPYQVVFDVDTIFNAERDSLNTNSANHKFLYSNPLIELENHWELWCKTGNQWALRRIGKNGLLCAIKKLLKSNSFSRTHVHCSRTQVENHLRKEFGVDSSQEIKRALDKLIEIDFLVPYSIRNLFCLQDSTRSGYCLASSNTEGSSEPNNFGLVSKWHLVYPVKHSVTYSGSDALVSLFRGYLARTSSR